MSGERRRLSEADMFRPEDSDLLADIIWWIKGFRAGVDADSNSCPFGTAHEEALRRARMTLREETSR